MTRGELLKNARESADLSQADIAKKLSVTQAAVSKWEADGEIRNKRLRDVAEAYGLSLDDLIPPELSA